MPSSPFPSLPPPARWTRDDDKAFENAIATAIAPDWEYIAAAVAGKTTDEVRAHYGLLVEDLDAIEVGRVPVPRYSSTGDGELEPKGFLKSEMERRKGTPWREDEHRRFLEGLQVYGKGDWRSIARFSVRTRTPTQVASHAQKFFIRQSNENKERRRASIHDITCSFPPSRLQ